MTDDGRHGPPASEVAAQLYEALRDRDLDRLVSVLAPDLVAVLADGLPFDLGGAHHGRAAMLAAWARIDAEIALDARPDRVRDIDEHTVEVVGSYVGTVRSTGRPLLAPFVHHLVVRAGSVVRLDQTTDTQRWHDALRPAVADR